MQFEAKYVIGKVRGRFSSPVVAVVFPQVVMHKHVADTLFIEGSIVSAGFCQVSDNEVTVYGRSEAMDVSSHPGRDEVHIQMAIGLNK